MAFCESGWLDFVAYLGCGKVLATILCIIALPALIICLLFAGGIVLLLPLALIAGVVGVLDACT